MSVLQIVAIKDLAVNGYARPVFVQSTAIAVRSFRDEVNRTDADNNMNRHPQDFELWSIATFDDESGTFNNLMPERLARAIDLKEQTQ